MLTREDPKNLLTIDRDITIATQRDLKKLRMYDGEITGDFDREKQKALTNFVNINNFENKMREERRI
ncbi:MAG: putative peptidoglycan binding domain-containing protein [Candidatus Bathyarchaeia archaeon]